MFGNFLEETATGTGATLALAGATTGNIQFQEKFADGDLVHYVVDDSGGTIKVGGIGTYVSATDDITRQDTWSWNGSTWNDSPATNITLSGGTHTVRCDALSDDLSDGGATTGRYYMSNSISEITGSTVTSATDRIYYSPLILEYSGDYDAFAIDITAVAVSGDVRFGLYKVEAGLPTDLIAVYDTPVTVTTGLLVAAFDGGALNLKKGHYAVGLTNETAFTMRSSQADSANATFLGSGNGTVNDGTIFKSLTFAAMPDPADVSGVSYQNAAIAFSLRKV